MNRTLLERVRATAWLWAPCLLVAVFAAPSIPYLLPSYYCHLGESYQPLRALRFFHSLGADYHKYGPMPNFLLAPGYGVSMAYWWLTGSFAHPSGDFPYGFVHPLQQLSFLIFQGRVLFLLLFLGLCAVMMTLLRSATTNRAAIALAFLVGVGTNYGALQFAAMTRPDGPMYAFLGASLGLYARILYDGPTLRRGVWLSLLAVFAISTKEIAGPVYVLPYLGLGWRIVEEYRREPARRAELLRISVYTLGTGVGAYLLLNVVYAPATWWLRMTHWLGGSGADSAVWGGVGSGDVSRAGFALELAQSFLNTLGPGGSVLTLLGLGALLARRPANTGMLLLPFASTLLLALIPMGYVSDNFTTVATVCLVPPLAVGFAELFAWARAGQGARPLGAVVALALAVNLGWATFTWVRLDGLFWRVTERELAEHPPGDATISAPDVHPEVPGKSRLASLGYHVDYRSLQEIIDAPPDERPDRIYLSSGMNGFIEDAMHQPARAAMLREEGLDVSRWQGIASLGYELVRTVRTDTPRWFWFDWMPAVAYWRGQSPVYVYERIRSAGPGPHDG